MAGHDLRPTEVRILIRITLDSYGRGSAGCVVDVESWRRELGLARGKCEELLDGLARSGVVAWNRVERRIELRPDPACWTVPRKRSTFNTQHSTSNWEKELPLRDERPVDEALSELSRESVTTKAQRARSGEQVVNKSEENFSGESHPAGKNIFSPVENRENIGVLPPYGEKKNFPLKDFKKESFKEALKSQRGKVFSGDDEREREEAAGHLRPLVKLERLLGPNAWANDKGKWGQRFWHEDWEKVQRVADSLEEEVNRASRGHRPPIRIAAAFAECELWKRFGKSVNARGWAERKTL